jgi:hypothetical protein
MLGFFLAHDPCTSSLLQRINRMRMLDNGNAEICWQLKGQVAIFPIDITMTDTFSLNLLTGRVLSHR